MGQVFISYSRKDVHFVETHLVGVCRDAGYEPWYDLEGISAADEWERTILNAIQASEWLLLVMSQHSAASDNVLDELHVALGEAGIPVIPLMIEDCSPLDFHMRLNRIQYIDFRKDSNTGAQQLFKRLARMDRTVAPVIETNTTQELISIAASLLPRLEVKHLKNIAKGRTRYTGRGSMRHEIRHLCSLGLLKRKQDQQIGRMKDNRRYDLSEFVELTDIGKLVATTLPGVKAK